MFRRLLFAYREHRALATVWRRRFEDCLRQLRESKLETEAMEKRMRAVVDVSAERQYPRRDLIRIQIEIDRREILRCPPLLKEIERQFVSAVAKEFQL